MVGYPQWVWKGQGMVKEAFLEAFGGRIQPVVVRKASPLGVGKRKPEMDGQVFYLSHERASYPQIYPGLSTEIGAKNHNFPQGCKIGRQGFH